MTDDKYAQYFLAILPPLSLQEKVTAIKESFREKYATRASLKSPPHITLHMPFRWKPHKEQKLLNSLQAFSRTVRPFHLSVDGYGAFSPRVIFLKVDENDYLQSIRKRLVTLMRTDLHVLNADYKEKPFHPHMTVAFRDLKKPDFHMAWQEVKDRELRFSFEVMSLTLLKHQEGRWQAYRELTFEETDR